jgi:uncharacterized protein (TIGR03790 family)
MARSRFQVSGVRCQVGGALLLLSASAFALGPHEIAVLVNGNSPASVEIANHFVHLRQVPAANVIRLPMPDRVLEPQAELTPEEFAQHIWEPADKAVRDRGIADHILAWAYSADFPVRIRGTPPLSIQGITFVRNKLPPGTQVDDGQFLSPLFRGPDQAGGPFAPSVTLEQFTPALNAAMPLPSMMIGYTGSRGLPVERVLAMLRYGALSDGTAPAGAVHFRLSDDVRATCRSWQFDAADGALRRRGVRSSVSSNDPPAQTKLIGYVTGASWAQPPRGCAFLPGSVADNLTSFGAAFHHDDQTKLTDWLRAGATAASGTVAEPYAMWTKFPHGRFFEHYAEGCTVLESYFLALRSPLQILLVGDPLARPWGRPFGVTLVNLQSEHKPASGEATFFASASGAGPERLTYLFLLDGRSVPQPGSAPQLKLDTTRLNDGYHELRAVAYTGGPVRHQASARLFFAVRNHGRSARLTGIPESARLDHDHAVQFGIEAEGEPESVALICQERVVWQAPHEPGKLYALEPRLIGMGPNMLQAVGLYADKEAVRGASVRVTVESLNRPPAPARFAVSAAEDGSVALGVEAVDPEGDPWTVEWFCRLLPEPGTPLPEGIVETVNAEILADDAAWVLKPKGGTALCLFTAARGSGAGEFEALLKVPPAGAGLKSQVAALAFNVAGQPDRFSYFGLFGDQSAWVLGTSSSGRFERAVSRGAPIEPDRWYRIGVKADGSGTLVGSVDGQPVARSAGPGLIGRVGLVCANTVANLKEPILSPPGIAGATTDAHRLVLPAAALRDATNLVARTRDHVRFADMSVALPPP